MRVVLHDPMKQLQAESNTPVCFIMSGGAWRTVFFLGVVEYLQTKFSTTELAEWSFCGTSAGAVYALALAIGMPHAILKDLLVRCADRARANFFGVVGQGTKGPLGKMLRDVLNFLPEGELVRRLRGRIAITFTRLVNYTPTAFQATDFCSREELKEAILGSGNVPIFADIRSICCGHFKVQGFIALDGGLTEKGQMPILPACVPIYAMCCGEDAALLNTVCGNWIHVIRPSEFKPVFSWDTVCTPMNTESIEWIAKDAFEQTKVFFDYLGATVHATGVRLTDRVVVAGGLVVVVAWVCAIL